MSYQGRSAYCVRSTMADPTDESNLEKRERGHGGVQDNSGTGPGRPILPSRICSHITTGRTAERNPPSATSRRNRKSSIRMLQLPGRPYTGGSTHGGKKRKTAGQGKTGSSRSETEHDQVHDLHEVTPSGMEDWWEQTKRHDGLIIAGRPYSIEEECLETKF